MPRALGSRHGSEVRRALALYPAKALLETEAGGPLPMNSGI
jgi:hypothetical protein